MNRFPIDFTKSCRNCKSSFKRFDVPFSSFFMSSTFRFNAVSLCQFDRLHNFSWNDEDSTISALNRLIVILRGEILGFFKSFGWFIANLCGFKWIWVNSLCGRSVPLFRFFHIVFSNDEHMERPYIKRPHTVEINGGGEQPHREFTFIHVSTDFYHRQFENFNLKWLLVRGKPSPFSMQEHFKWKYSECTCCLYVFAHKIPFFLTVGIFHVFKFNARISVLFASAWILLETVYYSEIQWDCKFTHAIIAYFFLNVKLFRSGRESVCVFLICCCYFFCTEQWKRKNAHKMTCLQANKIVVFGWNCMRITFQLTFSDD